MDMKKWLFLLILFIWVLINQAFAQTTPEGIWVTQNEQTGRLESLVEIRKDNDRLSGRIVEIFPGGGLGENPVCEKCPKEWLGQPILGMVFMWGFREKGDKWVDGRVLDSRDGHIYRSELSLTKDGKTLRLFGFVRLVVKIGKRVTWTRQSSSN